MIVDPFFALLNNPEFVLLHVPTAGVPEKMKLVRPATDPVVKADLDMWRQLRLPNAKVPRRAKDLRVHRYFAFSHLWGIPDQDKEQHIWNDIGDYMDDEHGDPMEPIPMRAEKRQTLLALFRAHPGSYWWIDVFCARVSTPLAIMGDIYAFCDRCYAMIDCEPRILKALANPKMQMQMYNDYVQIVDAEQDDKAAFLSTFVEKWSEQLQLMHQLTQSKWFKRVWTWQEAVLPIITCFFSEAIDDDFKTSRLDMVLFGSMDLWNLLEDPHTTQSLHKGALQVLRATFETFHEIFEAKFYQNNASGFNFTLPPSNSLVNTIATLGASTRRCMDPVDYVYGILGLFDFNIPRLKCHRALWRHFLAQLEVLIQHVLEEDDRSIAQWGIRPVASISISDKAYHTDLSTAWNMADVYDGLLEVTYIDIPEEFW